MSRAGNAVVTVFPDDSSFVLVNLTGEFKFGKKDPWEKSGSGSSHPDRVKRVSVSRTKQEVFFIARANPWDWFVTLTLNQQVCDRYDYDEATEQLRKFTRALKYREASWLIVPEPHQDFAIHFHGLVRGEFSSKEVSFSGHYDKHGRPVYNINFYRSGFTTATQIGDQAASSRYISKYIEKSSNIDFVPKDRRRFWASRDLIRPVRKVVDICMEDMTSMASKCVYSKHISNSYGEYEFYEIPSPSARS